MPKFDKKIVINDSLSTGDRVVLCAAEFFGTGILVLLGCMGCVAGFTSTKYIPHEQISLTFGIAVMIGIQCFGHISGGHINPAVTVAAAALGTIPLIQVPIYFVGQFAGAIAGFGVLVAVTPSDYVKVNSSELGVCSPAVNSAINQMQGFLVEFVATLVLILACCAIWDKRNSDKHDSVTIRLGLTVAALAMAAGPYTGANMNPARSFGPALWNGDWRNDQWVYWVGPLLAGLLGGLFYRIVFNKSDDPSNEPRPNEAIPLNDKA